jgi:hypothetical protein
MLAKATESESQVQCEDEVQVVAPDGGWGWLVAVASFLVHVVMDGITYGVFVIGLLDDFEASRQEVGWVGSIMIGVTYAAGRKNGYPMTSYLEHVIGGIALRLDIRWVLQGVKKVTELSS